MRIYRLMIMKKEIIQQAKDVLNEYGINLVELSNTKYSAIILAVSHSEFNSFDLRNYLMEDGIVYDVKGALPRDLVDARL